jgi:hypothetical protein
MSRLFCKAVPGCWLRCYRFLPPAHSKAAHLPPPSAFFWTHLCSVCLHQREGWRLTWGDEQSRAKCHVLWRAPTASQPAIGLDPAGKRRHDFQPASCPARGVFCHPPRLSMVGPCIQQGSDHLPLLPPYGCDCGCHFQVVIPIAYVKVDAPFVSIDHYQRFCTSLLSALLQLVPGVARVNKCLTRSW